MPLSWLLSFYNISRFKNLKFIILMFCHSLFLNVKNKFYFQYSNIVLFDLLGVYVKVGCVMLLSSSPIWNSLSSQDRLGGTRAWPDMDLRLVTWPPLVTCQLTLDNIDFQWITIIFKHWLHRSTITNQARSSQITQYWGQLFLCWISTEFNSNWKDWSHFQVCCQ